MPAMPTRSARPVIGFLTDFGLDGAAATCRGVIWSICRDAQIVDVCHTVRKYAIRDGAYILRTVLPYLPVSVHLAVVDPGVGTARRPIALRAERGDILVGPDNGLLLPAADALGGPVAVRVLENRSYWLPSATSSTFHGRDIFAPVTAHLAAGDAAFEDLGPSAAVADVERLPAPHAEAVEGELRTVVTYVDSFGNLRLAGGRDELERAFGRVEDGRPFVAAFAGTGGENLVEPLTFADTFGSVPPGAALLFVDSSGDLAVADNQGNAAARLGVTSDRPVTLTAG
jgi:S-adenosylmethionine hydrolase